MSASPFIMQTNKFLLIDATALTLGQGHGKVIQYILPDLYILCPEYLRFSSNVFLRERQKSLQWQTRQKRTENIVTPDWCDLMS